MNNAHRFVITVQAVDLHGVVQVVTTTRYMTHGSLDNEEDLIAATRLFLIDGMDWLKQQLTDDAIRGLLRMYKP